MSELRRRRAALARANARPPRFVEAARELVRGAPELLPRYSANPLALVGGAEDAAADDDASTTCAPCESTNIASAWVEDARRLSDRSTAPPELDVAHPSGGAVPADRGARKRDQLLNIFLFVAPFLRRKPDAVVVDFGCGGGHQSLPLAYHFPDACFVLVDAKRRSLDVARRRADAAGLANVRVVEGRIEDFDEPFDVGIALHACGAASDFAMEKCVAARAAYVVAPCCVGKIALALAEDAHENTAIRDGDGDEADAGAGGRVRGDGGGGSRHVRYPRSRAATSAVSTSSYVALAKAADFGGEGYDETARGAFVGGDVRGDDDCGYADSSEEEEDAEADAREAAALALAPVAEETSACSYPGDGSNPSDASSPRLSRGLLDLMAKRAAKKAAKAGAKSRLAPERLAERELQRRACKSLVEADRNRSASERGYATWQTVMEPPGCTPKNDVLVGVPSSQPEGDWRADAERAFEEAMGRPAASPAAAFFDGIPSEGVG
jgi:SAM-dependent methyltransferase